MANYVLVGGDFHILDTPYSTPPEGGVFGTVYDIPQPLADKAISEGAALLPEALFAQVGFTAEEIKDYPNPRMQKNAPVDWKLKHKAALDALHNYRAQLAPQE